MEGDPKPEDRTFMVQGRRKIRRQKGLGPHFGLFGRRPHRTKHLKAPQKYARAFLHPKVPVLIIARGWGHLDLFWVIDFWRVTRLGGGRLPPSPGPMTKSIFGTQVSAARVKVEIPAVPEALGPALNQASYY